MMLGSVEQKIILKMDQREISYARRSAAIKAYYEWMPIREQQNKRRIFREFKIGKLMHLIMLDTRQYARDKQIQPKEYLDKSGFNQAKFYNDLNSEAIESS